MAWGVTLLVLNIIGFVIVLWVFGGSSYDQNSGHFYQFCSVSTWDVGHEGVRFVLELSEERWAVRNS